MDFRILLILCFCWSASAAPFSITGAQFRGLTFVQHQVQTNAPYSWETETLTYGAAVTNNSGTIESNDFYAVDQFVKNAKTNGYWGYLTDVSPVAGNNTNAAAVKLVANPLAYQAKVHLGGGIGSADYSRTNGFNFDGSGKYLWPGLWTSNSSFSQITNGVMLGITGINTNSRGWLFGTYGTTPSPQLYALQGSYYGDAYMQHRLGGGNNDNGYSSGVQSIPPFGTESFTRINTNVIGIFQNGFESDMTTLLVYSTNLDAQYPVLIGARYDGTGVPTTAGSLPGQYRIGYFAVDSGIPFNLQTNYHADVRRMLRALGRIPARDKRRLAFVISGQSNSYGAGDPAADAGGVGNSVFGNLVGGSGHWFMATAATTNQFTMRNLASEYKAYSGFMAFSDQLSALSRTNGFADTNDCIYESFGVNGASYSALKNGTAPFIFSTNWASKQSALEYDLHGQTLQFPAVMIVHGENDSGIGNYDAVMREWQRDYRAALNGINSDSGLVPMLHSQIAVYAAGAAHSANDSMLQCHEEGNQTNVLVMPKYHLPYTEDMIHLSRNGAQRMGEQYAFAMFQILQRGWWEPLRPIAFSVTQNTNIVCTFTGAVSQIVLDTNSISWLSGKETCGFRYTNSTDTAAAIHKVAVTATNQLTISINTNITGQSGRLLFYAQNATTNSYLNGGTPQGNGGQLRDDNTVKGFISKSNLWNWCVGFKKTI